ncbi:MAG TPA: DUF1326 domain-containing protein [Gaiellaceae bacterium]
MAWRLEGTYFENCNCEVLCPCGASSLVLPADYERCQVVLAYHVERGEVDGLDVSERTVVLVADAPGQMSDGNWRVGVIIDDGASQEQMQALGSVFGGEQGGPPALLAPLIGELLGIEQAPIEYVDDGHEHRLKAGEGIELVVEDFVPEGESEPSRLTGVHHPSSSTLTVARATSSRIRAFGMEFQNEGKNGHSAPFAWTA